MCFSASASFTAAAGLALASVASFKKAKRPQQIMLSAIPLLFALQQFTEGLVWLSFGQMMNSTLQQVAAYTFIIFALIVWPVWIPASLVLLEEDLNRKKILQILFIIGCLWASILIWYLAGADVVAKIYESNMCYTISTFNVFSNNMVYFLLLYLIPVVLPFFISSLPHMWIFGLAGLLSCVAAYQLWYMCFLSVWCFFAAILSFILIALFPK